MSSDIMSPHTRALALFAGILGTFQALCWGIMALLAIIGHGDCPYWDTSSAFLMATQQMYFQDFSCPGNPINPNDVAYEWAQSIMSLDSINAWMIVLLSLDCVWFFTSLSLIAAWKSSRHSFTCSATAIWCVVTSVVMIVDLVACAMFGADYGKIISTATSGQFIYLAPPAVIMTLTARGFVLWFINLGLLTHLVKALPTIRQHKKAVKEHERQIAMAEMYGPPAPGHDSAFQNHGFVAEYPRSSSLPPRGYAMYPSMHTPVHSLPRPDYSPRAKRYSAAVTSRSMSPAKYYNKKPRSGF